MRLVNSETLEPLTIGQAVITGNGERGTLLMITEPHKPASTGRVYVRMDLGGEREFFPSVIGGEWIERGKNE